MIARPDFNRLAYDGFTVDRAPSDGGPSVAPWDTYEQIPVKRVFTAADLPTRVRLLSVNRRLFLAPAIFEQVYAAANWTATIL